MRGERERTRAAREAREDEKHEERRRIERKREEKKGRKRDGGRKKERNRTERKGTHPGTQDHRIIEALAPGPCLTRVS